MTTENTTPTADAAPASLSLNELKGCLQIIEVCTSRGAFKADELVAVGTIFQKLMEFVKQAEPAAEESAPADAPAQ